MPSFLASSAARAATTRWRTWSFTSANGIVRAGVYWAMRPATSVLGAISTASVFRFFSMLSGENSAPRNFALARAGGAPGTGVRRTFAAVRISSLSLSATGLRLSACSYTPLLKVSATSAYLRWACCFFTSASSSGFISSNVFCLGDLMSVTLMMW